MALFEVWFTWAEVAPVIVLVDGIGETDRLWWLCNFPGYIRNNIWTFTCIYPCPSRRFLCFVFPWMDPASTVHDSWDDRFVLETWNEVELHSEIPEIPMANPTTKCFGITYVWSNYSDLTRPHPKWWFSKGNPLISGKPRLVKYYSMHWVVLAAGPVQKKDGGEIL